MPNQSTIPPVAQFSLPTPGQQGSTQSPAASPQMPPVAQFSLPGATTQNQPSESFTGDLAQGNYGGAAVQGAKNVGNFLLPSIGDAYHDITGSNTKTGLQQLGDLGTTALSAATLIPGVDAITGPLDAARLAEGGADVASKAAPGLLSTVGKNAALGAGFGVTGALGSGQTDPGQIAQSGLLGGVGGGVLSAAGKLAADTLGKYSATGTDKLASQTNRLKTLSKSFETNSTPITNPIKTLGENNLIKDLSVEGGKVNASSLTNANGTGSIDGLIQSHSDAADKLVDSLEGGVTTENMKADVLKAVASNPTIRDVGGVARAQAEVNRIFSDYQNSFGDNLPYKVVNKIRAGMNTVYDPAERDVARTIGDTARSYLYNGDAKNTALRSAMQNESELIKAKNFVEKLHGTSVPGGQLGKYFHQLIGAGVGGAVGSVLGPFGEAGGAVIGGGLTHYLENSSQSRYFNPISTKVAGLLKKATGSKTGKITGGALKAGLLKGVSNL